MDQEFSPIAHLVEWTRHCCPLDDEGTFEFVCWYLDRVRDHELDPGAHDYEFDGYPAAFRSYEYQIECAAAPKAVMPARRPYR